MYEIVADHHLLGLPSLTKEINETNQLINDGPSMKQSHFADGSDQLI